MHLLLDVIKEVSKASLLFQRDDVTVSAVQLKIDTLCGVLDTMNVRPGEHVDQFVQRYLMTCSKKLISPGWMEILLPMRPSNQNLFHPSRNT